MTPTPATLRAAFRRGLRPPPVLDPATWADAHRVLTTAESATPGRWVTDRTPYLREPMERLSAHDPTPRVVMMFPSQVGKTEVALNWLGYTIGSSPCPMMMLQPTLADAETVSKQRIAHLVGSPELRGKVADPRSRDSGNTLLLKEFPGGVLYMVGANSPAGLAGKPMARLHADEPDRYPPSAGTEGDPLELARKRLSSWGARSKELVTSTPTVKGASRIETEYLASSQGVWEVPCPACGEYQPLVWSGLHWTGDPAEPETFRAWYECAHCGATFSETAKASILPRGRWRHQRPERLTTCWGGTMTALSAPVGGVQWRTLVAEFKAAVQRERAGDKAGLQVFVNTRLAETYEDRGERVEQGTLEGRVEPRWERLPVGVRVLTAGVDTHDDRLEVSVYGWGLGMEAWLVAHLTIPTDPLAAETWPALDDAILAPKWEREDGTHLRIASVCIDAGGHRTQSVLEYAMDRRRRGTVAAIIGARVPSAPIWQPKAGKSAKVKGARMHLVGRHASSEALAAILRVHQPGPLYLHVPEGTPAHWFREMTAQKRVESTIRAGRDRGRKVWQWEPAKAGADDHAWDCARYALAALHRLMGMWLRLDAPRAEPAAKPELPAPVSSPSPPQPATKPPVDKMAKPEHDTTQARPARPKPRARSPWGWHP